jgi:hypothetical protein
MKVVLAQTQKPPFETRIYDKIANSLLAINHLEIQILGADKFESREKNNPIKLLPVFITKRGLTSRFYNIKVFWRYLLKLNPDILIVCSPELLVPAVIYKLAFGKRLILDIQENYSLNFSYQSEYLKFKVSNERSSGNLLFMYLFGFSFSHESLFCILFS